MMFRTRRRRNYNFDSCLRIIASSDHSCSHSILLSAKMAGACFQYLLLHTSKSGLSITDGVERGFMCIVIEYLRWSVSSPQLVGFAVAACGASLSRESRTRFPQGAIRSGGRFEISD